MVYVQNQKITSLDTLDDTTIVNADLALVGDASDSGRAKGITWTSIKAFLKAYFDTLYPSGSGTSTGTNTGNETTTTEGALINGATSKTTPVDADYVGLMDSAASNVLNKLSWANLKATLKTYFDTIYVNPVYKVGTATYDLTTASAAQNIAHGLSTTPKLVRLTAYWASDTAGSSGATISHTFTVYNGSTQASVAAMHRSSTNSTGNSSLHSALFRAYGSSDGTDYQSGVVTFDATNIIITWTKTATPTGTLNIVWEAI